MLTTRGYSYNLNEANLWPKSRDFNNFMFKFK